ncbi:MAG: septum formation protein Maf [Bacteroidota bacterium]|jgi:septum formation protein
MSLPPFKKIILGSGSPRRKQLLEGLGWPVTVRKKDVEELFPDHLKAAHIPLHLAELKAMAFDPELTDDELLITADTIVWLNDIVLGKPVDEADAINTLKKLQGNTHQVFTGVCLTWKNQRHCFSTSTDVTFRHLTEASIIDYVKHYQPMDKAGAYGAQECLPAGMDPLSENEKLFLQQIGKPNLFTESLAVDAAKHVPIIEKINGSYFNVMGLPLVELWAELQQFTKSQV